LVTNVRGCDVGWKVRAGMDVWMYGCTDPDRFKRVNRDINLNCTPKHIPYLADKQMSHFANQPFKMLFGQTVELFTTKRIKIHKKPTCMCVFVYVCLCLYILGEMFKASDYGTCFIEDTTQILHQLRAVASPCQIFKS
jgi:hypothetical protein